MSKSRVLTVRFSEREYEALCGLSVIEDEPISALIRIATGEYLRRITSDTEAYERKVSEAAQRAETAHRELLESIGVEHTGSIRL
ncbi:hypothetical protein GCM10025789_30910 [Tessaracoccus lubricantis]|uniref:CopG family transcriptional regulator n=1 Tax=Tessaracoccus lubricantis TaxID=545543 RepID=A0ABP9FMX1_9ACTN